jgi:hypothetical protein
VLAEQLQTHGVLSPELPGHVFRAQARFLRTVWDLATGADFHFETTEGTRPPLLKPINRYMDALFVASNDDDTIRHLTAEVMHLLRPPGAFFAPGVAARVARHSLRERVRQLVRPRPAPDAWPVLAPS